MQKLMTKCGTLLAALAMLAAALNVNATCAHHVYQDRVPESAKKLSKIK